MFWIETWLEEYPDPQVHKIYPFFENVYRITPFKPPPMFFQ